MATLTKHAGPGLVAVMYVTLALAEGGFDSKALAAVTVAVWWLVIVGLFVRVWPGSSAPAAAIACGGSLAVLGALAGLSLFWADDPGRAFDDVVRIAAYLGLFVFGILASRPASAASWAGGLTVGLAAVAALALFSRFEPGLLTDGAGDLATAIPSAAGRLSWPMGYWNGLAACMALAVVALVWMGDRGRGRLARALAVAAVPLPILAIYLTQSMGGAAAAGVGVAALLFAARERIALAVTALAGALGGGLLIFLGSRRDALIDAVPGADLRSQGDEMLVLTLLVVAVLGAGWYLLDGPLARLRALRLRVSRTVVAGVAALVVIAGLVAIDPIERWDDFKDPGTLAELPSAPLEDSASPAVASAAGNGRYQWWSAAIDGWQSEPLIGLGAGNWELYWNSHNSLPVVTAEAHTLYLETLAELGPLGVLALLAFFATAIYAGFGRRRSSRGEVAVWLGLIGAGIVSAAGEWSWEIPAATMPIVLAAAMLTGPATLRPPWPRAIEAEAPEGSSRRAGFGLGVATMLAGFTCIWIAGVSLLTTVQLDESRAAANAGDLDAAAKNASYAAAIQPWSPEPRLRLALVEEQRGRYHEAREAAEEAIDRASNDWRTWVVLARIEALDGEPEAAERALARANELSPVPLPVELPPAR